MLIRTAQSAQENYFLRKNHNQYFHIPNSQLDIHTISQTLDMAFAICLFQFAPELGALTATVSKSEPQWVFEKLSGR